MYGPNKTNYILLYLILIINHFITRYQFYLLYGSYTSRTAIHNHTASYYVQFKHQCIIYVQHGLQLYNLFFLQLQLVLHIGKYMQPVTVAKIAVVNSFSWNIYILRKLLQNWYSCVTEALQRVTSVPIM